MPPLFLPTLFSTPLLLIWIILPAFTFVPESPFISSCAKSTVVAWSLGKATKMFDIHVLFYKHDVYKHIQAYKHIQQKKQRRTPLLLPHVKCLSTSTLFVPLAGHSLDDELGEDASFLDEIGRLLDSPKTSTLFLPHRTKLFSDYNDARRSVKRRIEQKNK